MYKTDKKISKEVKRATSKWGAIERSSIMLSKFKIKNIFW